MKPWFLYFTVSYEYCESVLKHMMTCIEENEKKKKDIDDLLSVSNLQELPNDSNTEITYTITADNNTADGEIDQNMNNSNMNDEKMNNSNLNNEKEHSNVTYRDLIKHIDAVAKGAFPYILYLIL